MHSTKFSWDQFNDFGEDDEKMKSLLQQQRTDFEQKILLESSAKVGYI